VKLSELPKDRRERLTDALCHQIEATLLMSGVDNAMFGLVLSDDEQQTITGNLKDNDMTVKFLATVVCSVLKEE
jgi:hypothetical protein